MRISLLVLAVFAFVTLASAQDKYVLPNKNNTPVYESASKGTQISKVKKEDRLQVLSEKNGMYRVKTPDGKLGWVAKKSVSKTDGKAYTFDNIEVEGYLDNPTPIYITDMDEGANAPIDLDRSFEDALKRNVDKETVMRTAR